MIYPEIGYKERADGLAVAPEQFPAFLHPRDCSSRVALKLISMPQQLVNFESPLIDSET